MNKLRKYYSDLQSDAKNNFDKVTADRAKKLLAFTNQQCDAQVQQGEFGNLEELTFYQEKFTGIQNIFKESAGGKIKKSKIQADINTLIANNYGQAPVGPTPHPQYLQQEPARQPEKKEQIRQVPRQERQVSQPQQASGNDPKDQLSSFFSKHRNEAEKKKVGFKSIIDTIPKAGPQKKYVVKSKVEMQRNNDDDIMKMNSEIHELNRKLESEKEQRNFNQGLYDSERKNYENRIQDLATQIDRLNRENHRIRQEARAEQENKFLASNNEPMVETKIVYQQEGSKKYNPHQIDYQENNLQKINMKNQNQYEYDHKSESMSSHHRELPYEKAPSEVKAYHPVRRQSEEDLMRDFQDQRNQVPIKYNEVSASNYRFNRSEAENEDKNIELRSKLSFFKQQIVLYRGRQIQVAIRSFDLIDLQSRKIYIFINNKDKYDRQFELSYEHDPNYYYLDVVRKATEIKGYSQGKEEIQLRLKDQRDFDSMIQVKLRVLHTGHKEIKFLLPAMFLEFTNRTPEKYNTALYEKNFITPFHQFSSIYLAMEIIPFFKEYEENIPIATVFARSKYHEGYITLRYKAKGEIQIETIAPWKLFISYLLSKEY